MAALEVIRRIRTIATVEGMDRVAAELGKVASANRELASASEATARVTDTTAKRQLSVSQAWDRAMASMQNNARAAQAYTKEMHLLNQAIEQGIVSEREAARFRAFSNTKYQAAGAPTANVDQSAINGLLGVNDNVPNSARASAEAFEQAAREADQMAAAVTRLKAQLDPLGAAQDRLNAELAEYKAMAAAGAISSNELAAATAMAQAKFGGMAGAAGRAGAATKLSAGQLANMQFQLQDIGVSLASGQSPFTVLMQQGSQLAQGFGPGTGLRGALAAVGTGIVSFLTNPLNLAVAGVAALAAVIPMVWRAVTGGSVNAEEAMKRHTKIVDEVREAYKRTRDGVEELNKAIKNTTFLKALKDFQDMKKLADEAKRALEMSMPNKTTVVRTGRTQFSTKDVDPDILRIAELSNQAAKGAISFDALIKKLDDIGRTNADQKIQDMALRAQEAAIKARDAATAMNESKLAMDAVGGSATAAAGLVNNLAASMGTAEGAAQGFAAGLRGIAEFVPELQKQLKMQSDLKKIADDHQAMVNGAIGTDADMRRKLGEADSYLKQGTENILGRTEATKALTQAERDAAQARMNPRDAAVAKVHDQYDTIRKENSGAFTMEETIRLNKAEADAIAAVNAQYDEKAAKVAAQDNAYKTAIENIQQDTAMTLKEADAIGLSCRERDKELAIRRLELAAKEAGIALSPKIIAQIQAEAEASAVAQQKLREAQQQQEDMRARMQFFGDMTLDLFTGLSKGADGFKDAIDRIKDSLIQAMLQATILGQGPLAGLFGTANSSGGVGGIFGGILGAFGKGGGGGGGILSGILGLFGGGGGKGGGGGGWAVGGHVTGPGTGRSDSIPAWLSNGEFVVNAQATLQNRQLLEAINSGQLPRFAEGGLVNLPRTANIPNHAFGMWAANGNTPSKPNSIQISNHFDLRGVDPSMRAFVKQQVAQGTRTAVRQSVEQVSQTSRRIPGYIYA